MTLYRITLIEKNGERTVTTWSESIDTIISDIKTLLPLSTIKNITEVTNKTLIIK